MNGFDAVLLGVLVVFGVIGALRGMVREVLSLATWILSCVIAWFLAGSLEGRFEGVTETFELRMVLAFVTLFAVVFVLSTVAAYFINKIITSRRTLRLPNTLLGSVMGVTRGGVVIVIVFLLAGLTAIPQKSWWRAALLTPFFQNVALFVGDYLPSDVIRHIRYD